MRRPVSCRGVPWRAWCGNLSTLMEYHEELVKVDTLMEYHEEFVRVDMRSRSCGGIVTPAEFCWAYPWICGESVFSG